MTHTVSDEMSLPKYIINIKKNNYSIVYQAFLKVAASDVQGTKYYMWLK